MAPSRLGTIAELSALGLLSGVCAAAVLWVAEAAEWQPHAFIMALLIAPGLAFGLFILLPLREYLPPRGGASLVMATIAASCVAGILGFFAGLASYREHGGLFAPTLVILCGMVGLVSGAIIAYLFGDIFKVHLRTLNWPGWMIGEGVLAGLLTGVWIEAIEFSPLLNSTAGVMFLFAPPFAFSHAAIGGLLGWFLTTAQQPELRQQ